MTPNQIAIYLYAVQLPADMYQFGHGVEITRRSSVKLPEGFTQYHSALPFPQLHIPRTDTADPTEARELMLAVQKAAARLQWLLHHMGQIDARFRADRMVAKARRDARRLPAKPTREFRITASDAAKVIKLVKANNGDADGWYFIYATLLCTYGGRDESGRLLWRTQYVLNSRGDRLDVSRPSYHRRVAQRDVIDDLTGDKRSQWRLRLHQYNPSTGQHRTVPLTIPATLTTN